MPSTNWEVVIGLEIHAQLKTESKLFSSDSASFGAGDNENVSEVSLGFPGTLPVINKRAIELGLRAGLALNCEIKPKSFFARKNYFYPDLPKGYQISQYEEPLCGNGSVEIFHQGQKQKVRIERAHLEEDAGKSTHLGQHSLINFNRAGVPLLEIVSKPDMKSPAEAAEYARTIRRILRYIDVCDGNLEEGSLRCDCNVSVRAMGDAKLGVKVEIKNLNSFSFIEKALEFEARRQMDCLEAGEKIHQETRLYDSVKNKTFSMRGKEEAQDYRYFPDPDLLPVDVKFIDLVKLRELLPELPLVRAERFISQWGLSEYDAFFLTEEKALADYFEQTVQACGQAKLAANWIMSELVRALNDSNVGIENSPVKPAAMGQLIDLVESGTISGKIGKQIFPEMWSSGRLPQEIVQEKGLAQMSNSASLELIVNEVLSAHPQQVAEYRSGKHKVFGFFVGQVMKKTKGQANPELINKILQEKLA